MATWTDASTNEYWDGSNQYVYAGSGVWEANSGPGAELCEYYASPLKGDPYTYENAATVRSIRFKISGSAIYATVAASIITNKSNTYPTNEITYTFTENTPTVHDIEISYDPEEGERPTSIMLSGEWGLCCVDSPLLYDIQVDLVGGEEEEPSPCCLLYKTTGRTKVTIPDPPDYPPIKTIPKPVITGDLIPSPYDEKKPFKGITNVNTPYPTPGGSGTGGRGGGCDACYIRWPKGVSGIQIPPGCCQVILIIG